MYRRISYPPNDFSSKPFGEPRNFIGLAKTYDSFLLAVYHPFLLREAGRAPQKGLPEHQPSIAHQRSRRSLREFYGVTVDPSRAGNRTLSSAGSRPPVETPSQRDPAAAQEERSVVEFVGSVSMKFGE